MRRLTVPADPAPLSAINITPLIDVMLVLLIMLILTIPAVTHKVPIELPGAGQASGIERDAHRLRIAASGALSWDGVPLADAELPARLAALLRAGGELHLETDPEARYDRFDAILAVVKRAGIERLGFIGNERMAG